MISSPGNSEFGMEQFGIFRNKKKSFRIRVWLVWRDFFLLPPGQHTLNSLVVNWMDHYQWFRWMVSFCAIKTETIWQSIYFRFYRGQDWRENGWGKQGRENQKTKQNPKTPNPKLQNLPTIQPSREFPIFITSKWLLVFVFFNLIFYCPRNCIVPINRK